MTTTKTSLNLSINEYVKQFGNGKEVTFENRIFHQQEVSRYYNGTYTNKLTFKNCDFTSTFKIHGYSEIDFIDCTFQKLWIANSLNSDSTPSLIDVKFSKESSLEELLISGVCYVKVENCKIKDLIFDSRRNRNEGLSLINVRIRNLVCRGSEMAVDAVEEFHKPEIDSVTFYECLFENIPGVNLFNFGQQVDFVKCNFLDVTANNHSSFRHLKSNFIRNNNEFLSNFFAGYELKSKFKMIQKKDGRFEYFLNEAYHWINDFGLNPYRPFWILLLFSSITSIGLSLLSFVVAYFYDYPRMTFDLIIADPFHNFVVLLVGPFRILSDNFNLVLIDELNYGPLKFILSAISSILLFFLILGIRKRFKIDG